jgi:hypothetical protein
MHRREINARVITLTVVLIMLCFLLADTARAHSHNSIYPNGTTLEDSSGRIYYPNGSTARDTYGHVYYPNGTTLRDRYGGVYYPNGTMLRDRYGGVYYPNGTTLRDRYGRVSYSDGTTARDTYGHTYYENGTSAGGPVTVTVEIGCGLGALKLRASNCSSHGFLFIPLGYQFCLCLDIDSGHCSIEQL